MPKMKPDAEIKIAMFNISDDDTDGGWKCKASMVGTGNDLLNLVVRALEAIVAKFPADLRMELAKPFCEQVAEIFLTGNLHGHEGEDEDE